VRGRDRASPEGPTPTDRDGDRDSTTSLQDSHRKKAQASKVLWGGEDPTDKGLEGRLQRVGSVINGSGVGYGGSGYREVGRAEQRRRMRRTHREN
jgi:hypothetical protein